MKKKIVRVVIIVGVVLLAGLCLHVIVNWSGSANIIDVIRKMHGG
ncbi:MAG TPA: hypothetical protein VF857_09670 [Spirochaetota bacterium]